jgi:Arc/MetJ-type ribon-helix-helix transcriptional regulator
MNVGTKKKTSVTLSPQTVRTLNRLAGKDGNRSAVIELAIRTLARMQKLQVENAKDMQILERESDRLNDEALDVLGYQVDL